MSAEILNKNSRVFFRKTLTKNNLILAQPFIQKIDGTNSTGQLLHLPRFFVAFKPKYIILTEKIVEILKGKPNYMAEYANIKSYFDAPLQDTIRKLFRMSHFIKLIATDLVSFYLLAFILFICSIVHIFFLTSVCSVSSYLSGCTENRMENEEKG